MTHRKRWMAATMAFLALGMVSCEDRPVGRDVTASKPVGRPAPDASPRAASSPEGAPGGTAHAACDVSPGHDLALERDFDIGDQPVSLRIAAPAPDSLVTSDVLELTVDLQGYDTAFGSHHVHVIIDNEPYLAYYDAGRVPFRIDLSTLAPGAHTIRAFPSRAWHESVKQPGAFASSHFFYKRRTGRKVALDGPILTFSRPKGNYEVEPEANRVLLDWYVTGCTMGETCRVRYTVDERPPVELDQWLPVWLEALPEGSHTITLELLDGDGRPIDHPYNRTTRHFGITLKTPAS